MKKKTKWMLGLAVACGATLALAGCTGDQSPYTGLDSEKYNVSVRYDSNGGNFAYRENVEIVHVYSLENAKLNGDNYEITLIEPGSDALGDKKAYSEISYADHFLAGWYQTREPRVNEQGEPLDEYGELVSVSGRAQGYVYGGKWDFSKPLTIAAGSSNSSKDAALTLYAGWIPNFLFEIVSETEKGEEVVGSYAFNPDDTQGKLEIPAWNESTGAIDMKNFPAYSGYTFEHAYSSSDKQEEYTAPIEHGGSVNAEKGIAIDPIKRVYATWKEGTWFRISTAKQFVDNFRMSGYYEIAADLDFTDVNWKMSISSGTFNGKIFGNGHTFSNITVTQTNASDTRGGLFGEIGAKTEMTDLAFTNITYNLSAGSRITGSYFGLFAGYVSDQAVLDITVEGTLAIKDSPLYLTYFNQIGAFSGNLERRGVSIANIRCVTVESSDGTYPIKATVHEDGEVEITRNADPSIDPNV